MAAARHEEGWYENRHVFVSSVLVCKSLSNDDVGVARGITVFQGDIRPGAGFKTGDFVGEKLGGLPTVLNDSPIHY